MFTNIQIFTGIQVYSVLSQVVHSRICLWPSRCSHLDPLLIRAYIYKYTHITSQKLLYMKPCNADSQMFVPLRVLTCHSKNLVSKKKLTDKTPGSKCGGLVGFSVWIQNILEKQVLSVCRYIYIYILAYTVYCIQAMTILWDLGVFEDGNLTLPNYWQPSCDPRDWTKHVTKKGHARILVDFPVQYKRYYLILRNSCLCFGKKQNNLALVGLFQVPDWGQKFGVSQKVDPTLAWGVRWCGVAVQRVVVLR